MTTEHQTHTDGRIDRSLRETLGAADVPTLSQEFQDRLKAEIKQQPKPGLLTRYRPRTWLAAVLATYCVLGLIAAPWAVERLVKNTVPLPAAMVLLTAVVFSSVTALSVTLLYLRRQA